MQEGGKDVYDLNDWAAVHATYKRTKSKRETARILQMSRNTVKRLLKLKENPKYHRSATATILDDFKEQIIVWRCEPFEFNGTRIYRELLKRGYTGSIGPVYKYLQKVDEDAELMISSKATVRIETPPGDQAQFDWSEYNVEVSGVIKKIYCFAMILSASRKKAVCFSLKNDADAIYEVMQELFEDLGGVTLELLIDNPKALVIENNPKTESEIKYNPQALLLAKHLGTELNACPCYWPRKKGKIERPFNYIEEQFIKGNTFSSMEDLNARGKAFVNEWCNEKHTTTQRIPNEHYELEERSTLLPMPKKRFKVKELQRRIVSPDSLVSINANKYSVPVEYVAKSVLYRIIYGFRIEIFDRREKLILKVEEQSGKHNTMRQEEHYAAIAKKVSTSIPQIRRDFTEIFSYGAKYLDAAGRKFDQPTHYARKIMELMDLYDTEELDYLIGLSIAEDKMDINSFKKLLKEYNRKKSVKTELPDEPEGLTRDISYYEDVGRENGHGKTGA